MARRMVMMGALVLMAPQWGRAQESERSYGTNCEVGGKSVECRVRVRVSKVVATVADRIEVVLEARAAAGVAVEWPEFAEGEGQMDVLAVSDEPVAEVGVARRVIVLEPFLPGKRVIPGMTVRFGGAASGCVITTEPIEIEVKSLLEGETKEPELRGVVEPAPVKTAWWVWGAGGVVALGVAGAGVMLLRRRGEREVEPLTAYGEAMARLGELEGSPLLAEGRGSEYCAQLGEVLRRYVGRVMGLGEADRTTEELMRELGHAPGLNVAQLGAVLGRLDEAGFAGGVVEAAEALELREKVQTMVMGMQAGAAMAERAGEGA